jgi:hypothetical protein
MRRTRTLLLTAAATAALSAVPLTANAHAIPTELIDRAMYDSTIERTAGSLHIDGPTRGELGGYFDLTVTARDGSLPTGSNVCERATVEGVLTLSPGETFEIERVRGELCTSFYGDSLVLNSTVRWWNADYEGSAHRKGWIVGEGLLAASFTSWFGGQASFTADVWWW